MKSQCFTKTHNAGFIINGSRFLTKTTEQNRILSVGLPQAAQSWQKNKGPLYLTSKKKNRGFNQLLFH